MKIREYFLTFCGIGRISGYRDDIAMVSAAVIGAGVLAALGGESLFMLTLFAAIVGIFEINKECGAALFCTDGTIVIDKVVGIWLAETVATQTPSGISGIYGFLFAVLLSAAAFIFLTRMKPSTIGWIHRSLKGGLGVMLDDILAGFAAGLLSVLILKSTVYVFC